MVSRRKKFLLDALAVATENERRLEAAQTVELPELERLEITVLSEWEADEGFGSEAGVSYLFKAERASVLYDVGFGPERGVVGPNASKLGVNMDDVNALVISHLHPDHMGGLKASRSRTVTMPEELKPSEEIPCYLPDKARAPGFKEIVVDSPTILPGGMLTTGPLARSLFFMGWTEEQALVANIKGKGLAVFTGCGHQTIQLLTRFIRRLSDIPIYAIGGGLHCPVTNGRGNIAGVQVQRMIGTGKPPWEKITDGDLSEIIESINAANPKRVFLSAHDSCDHSISRLTKELTADVETLVAGGTYEL